MFFDYIYLLCAFFLFFLIAFIITFLSYLIIYKTSDLEKISAYECGFDPFQDARLKFEVSFYLVAILFIIFDLEITFLYPWILNIYLIDFISFWSMILFLFILTLGFFYEWLRGGLDWM
jgi:NADH:ubiquinone oxidoreductase subunit 3 (subunit A)